MSDYDSWKEEYRNELEAYEGEGPPTPTQLWDVARIESGSASNWIEDMPCNKREIKAYFSKLN